MTVHDFQLTARHVPVRPNGVLHWQRASLWICLLCGREAQPSQVHPLIARESCEDWAVKQVHIR